LSLDNDLGLAWAAQGLVYMASDKYDDARDALKKAIILNPSYAMAYMWYGSLQEDFEDTTRMYEKAFQLDPNSAVAGYNLANNLIDLGRDADAMDVFSKIVDADPFYPNAYFLVGKLSLANGRLDQAIINFNKSYDLGETMNTPVTLAHIYADISEIENSRYWIALAEEQPKVSKPGILDWLKVRLYAEEGDWDSAKKGLYAFADTSKTDTVKGYMDAVLANYFLEDYPATITSFEAAKKKTNGDLLMLLKKDWLERLVYVAYAYTEVERHDEANEIIDNIRRFVQEDADKGFRVWPQMRFTLGLVEAVEGNADLALVTIQRAVNQGWINPWQLENEPILRDLKTHPDYIDIRQSLLARVRIIKEQLAYEERFSAI
jgi:tetratricopeptide (TPR) repeat protein